MKTTLANPSLAELLDQHTTTADAALCRVEGDRLRCLACGHRCSIGPEQRGICKVRFVSDGELKVPFGYVAGLQCDPVEKKPFFHVYPGSDALTFGMMGCDLHCAYCFPGDTLVMTGRGPLALADAFQGATRKETTHDAEIAYPVDLQAVTGSGTLKTVRAVFKHHYRGPLTVLRPYYLPELRCTPDHRVYATADPGQPPQPVKAGELTERHYLAIPRHYAFASPQVVNAAEELRGYQTTYAVPWELSPEDRQAIVEATARGETSRQIGAALGKNPSYIRHVRSKIARGRAQDVRTSGILLEKTMLRFPNEHRPGTPQTIPLDTDFARLLGYYCAEGCVSTSKKRPNSHTLNFSFSPVETELVEEVCHLLGRCFGIQPQRVMRKTTLAICLSKASTALLFKSLAGGRSRTKQIPRQLFAAPRPVVEAFLDAYLRGDGHRYANEKVCATTVSRQLAHGVAYLALKLGFLPSIYDSPRAEFGTIQGRSVKLSPHQYSVVWYEDSPAVRKVIQTDNFYLVPLRAIATDDHDGDVYNMEVDEEHNYLAGLFLVSNCQNWVTSQALRDSAANAPIRRLTPAQLIEVGLRERARLVVSSYNEPLITAEWAVAVFERARAAGLACAFVSNGNATPEVLDFLQPWVVAYKVDLKTFNDRNYRKLGGTLENITDTIRMVHARGIWLEVVTLVIPSFNDGSTELRQIARFLADISPDIPWHVTAFHKDYRMTDPDATPVETLVRAAEIGTEEGLRYVYVGNLPGRVGAWENTRCPACHQTVIERTGYLIRAYRLTPGGRCPHCHTQLAGVWPEAATEVKTGNDRAAYQSRLPRQVIPQQLPSLSPSQDRRQGLPVLASPRTGGTPVSAVPNSPAPASPATPGHRPHLDPGQKQQILATVAALLHQLATGQTAAFPVQQAAADTPVSGAFVSLKRGRHLRACCGMLGQPLPLHQALTQAADRTIWEDERFPPVSPTELEHLTLEVWMLFNPQPVQARGAERAAAFTLGTHGVKVVRGQASGLFLPSVPVENHWDVTTMLDRVCLKAGLPAAAWRDDATALFTFEGDLLHGPMKQFPPAQPHPPANPFRPEDVQSLTARCRVNLIDLLRGAAPHYFMGVVDGRLLGVTLSVQAPGSAEGVTFSRLSLRPGLALQATLFSLVQTAAQHLATRNLTLQAIETMPIGLTLLHDAALHGTVAEPHLDGLSPHARAVLVLERDKTGLLFDPSRSAEELVRDAAVLARVNQADGAAVFSLAAVSNAARVQVSTAPQPVRGPEVRPAAVAGSFYAADPVALARAVEQLLGDPVPKESWAAAMVPHAGWQYSGRIAADVLKRLQIPRTVIVLGPNHTGRGMDWAVAPHQTWDLPGVRVASDFLLARQLCQAIPGLEMDAVAHQQEHGIEVELPLLARLAPEARVVGITIANGDLQGCRRFARGLAGLLRERGERPLLLISSDMNHFANDAETRRLDALALAALERRDPAELFETVQRHHISMCGVLPAVIVLETLKLLGDGRRAERVGYATTADVTRDTKRVVGYAGMLFA